MVCTCARVTKLASTALPLKHASEQHFGVYQCCQVATSMISPLSLTGSFVNNAAQQNGIFGYTL